MMKQPWTIPRLISKKHSSANKNHDYIEEKKDDDVDCLEHSVGFRHVRDQGSIKIPPKKYGNTAALATMYYHVDEFDDEIVDGDNHHVTMGWEPGRVMDAVELNQKSTNYGRQPKFGHPLCTNITAGSTNSKLIHKHNIKHKNYNTDTGTGNKLHGHWTRKNVTYADEYVNQPTQTNLASSQVPHRTGSLCVDDRIHNSEDTCWEDITKLSSYLKHSQQMDQRHNIRQLTSSTSRQANSMTILSVKSSSLYNIPWTNHNKHNNRGKTLTTTRDIQLQKRLSFGESRVSL